MIQDVTTTTGLHAAEESTVSVLFPPLHRLERRYSVLRSSHRCQGQGDHTTLYTGIH